MVSTSAPGAFQITIMHVDLDINDSLSDTPLFTNISNQIQGFTQRFTGPLIIVFQGNCSIPNCIIAVAPTLYRFPTPEGIVFFFFITCNNVVLDEVPPLPLSCSRTRSNPLQGNN
ncbi:hypothetical protein F3Y22_tig00110258pilonHSYRG00010 [Hibiscus syriacus]|uniref:Uncharacterized protein n=1 Tax=Hibiscus syriacus TaxID=106335 RepID=A0A6A3B8L1_HIBSY|nr:hypothetical protein F3Y22_tig00110258pilonHSYRG00010 [Hibiscus syriacus]